MKVSKGVAVFLLISVCGAAAQDIYDDIEDYPNDEPIEGSGDGGTLDEPVEATTDIPTTPIVLEPENDITKTNEITDVCPDECMCSQENENDGVKFIVDCSNKGLKELPANIDTRATVLNIENNEIQVIPKSISNLKSLKVFNANKNSIAELAAGSISELPELRTLKLSNNRLLDFPQELRNAFCLTKLEEIDISGNDIRSTIEVENFSNFKSIRKIVLHSAEENFVDQLCSAYKDTLGEVCISSCETNSKECPDAPENIEGDFIKAKDDQTESNGALDNIDTKNDADESNSETSTDPIVVEEPEEPALDTSADSLDSTVPEENASSDAKRTLVRTLNGVVSNTTDGVSANSTVDNTDELSNKTIDINVGAATSKTQTGAMDKSIVGFVVAAMVLIVGGIIIQKNWSSLKKKFNSTPRPANERTNGTTPEEVPLKEKDKSPV